MYQYAVMIEIVNSEFHQNAAKAYLTLPFVSLLSCMRRRSFVSVNCLLLD